MNNDNDEWKNLLKKIFLFIGIGYIISMVLVLVFEVKFITTIDPNATTWNDILGLTILIGILPALIYFFMKTFRVFFHPKS